MDNLREVMDYDQFLANVGGRDDFARLVAREYLVNAAEFRSAIENALASGDAATIRTATHRLKGALGSLRANSAHAKAEEIEAHGRNGRVAEAIEAWPTLAVMLTSLEQALSGWLGA